jgi:hypothetical protein
MVSARSAEKIAARKEERLRFGKATCSEFSGGNRGREIKYKTVLLISTTFSSGQYNGFIVQQGEFTRISDSRSSTKADRRRRLDMSLAIMID